MLRGGICPVTRMAECARAHFCAESQNHWRGDVRNIPQDAPGACGVGEGAASPSVEGRKGGRISRERQQHQQCSWTTGMTKYFRTDDHNILLTNKLNRRTRGRLAPENQRLAFRSAYSLSLPCSSRCSQRPTGLQPRAAFLPAETVPWKFVASPTPSSTSAVYMHFVYAFGGGGRASPARSVAA